MEDGYPYASELLQAADSSASYNFTPFPYNTYGHEGSNAIRPKGNIQMGHRGIQGAGSAELLQNLETSESTIVDHHGYFDPGPGGNHLMAERSQFHPDDCWIHPAHYEFDQFSEYLHEEAGRSDAPPHSHQAALLRGGNMTAQAGMSPHAHHHFLPTGPAIHVNPSVIDGSFAISDKMVAPNGTLISLAGLDPMGCSSPHDVTMSPHEFNHTKKKAPRQAGVPTNVVPTPKMDRKTLKRLRNRVSASRCRVKKKNWIKNMEYASESLAEENVRIAQRITFLEEAISECQRLLLEFEGTKATTDSSTRCELEQGNFSSSTLIVTEDIQDFQIKSDPVLSLSPVLAALVPAKESSVQKTTRVNQKRKAAAAKA